MTVYQLWSSTARNIISYDDVYSLNVLVRLNWNNLMLKDQDE